MCRKFRVIYLLRTNEDMPFNVILKMKVNRSLALLLGIILIATVWYAEKTKQIPQYGIVLYQMGLSCEGECGQNKQLQYFQRAVRYNPKLRDTYYNDKLSDAHYRSALIYEEIGDHAKALRSFIKATEVNQNARAYYKIGLYYFREESYGHALRYFRRSYRVRINCPDDTLYYVAQIYDKTKEYNLAISNYLDFVEAHVEYASEVYPRIAEICHVLNDADVVLHKLRILRREHKNDLADQLEHALKAVQSKIYYRKELQKTNKRL